jgi:DNA-binding MarR family transcriptional regulator
MMTRPTREACDLDVWRRYRVMHACLMSHLARELTRATGLSEADYQILDALLDAPGSRARALELRWTLQWEKSRLSHQLARMASRGLIDRRECKSDARGLDVVLSSAGIEVAREARRVREETLRRVVFETLGPEQMAHLAEATALLAARLAMMEEEDPECREARAEAIGESYEERSEA